MTNISYELAKELKEAGFPQEEKNGWTHTKMRDMTEQEMEELRDEMRKAGIDKLTINTKVVDEECYLPTLSELIEAVGEDFRELQYSGIEDYFFGGFERRVCKFNAVSRKTKKCATCGKEKVVREEIGQGDTPEEAVARLYIALNKNKKEND